MPRCTATPLFHAPLDTIDRQTLDYDAARDGTLARRDLAVEGGVSECFDEAFKGVREILDAGCGTGRDLCRLLLQGHDAWTSIRTSSVLSVFNIMAAGFRKRVEINAY